MPKAGGACLTPRARLGSERGKMYNDLKHRSNSRRELYRVLKQKQHSLTEVSYSLLN